MDDCHAINGTLSEAETKRPEGEIGGPDDLEEFVRKLGKEFLRLNKPLVTKVYLPHPKGETVRAFCSGEDISCSGIRIALPARLDLTPGVLVNLELFLPEQEKPTAVKGVVSRIGHDRRRSVPRYIVEIRFGPLEGETLKNIAQYVHKEFHKNARLCA